jgi:hypothetical protein
MHQINQGSDINSGTTFIGNAAGHVAINCDSRCRINGQSLLTFSGSFNNLMVGQFDAQFNISAGVTLANNTTLGGAIFSLTLGSKLAFAGALTSGGTVTIADNLVMKSNSIACFSGFTTSGTFTGAREFVVVGGSVLNNSSANRLPHAGSSGIVTATGFNAGFAPDNAAGNTGVNSGAC